MEKPTKISWQAPEHVAIGAIILCFYFGNILFGIIIILFATISVLNANKKPSIFEFEINRQGVIVGRTLYPYSNLETFWVQDTEFDDLIIFRTRKSIQPYLILPFDSMTTESEKIRDYLLDYIDEEKMEEPFHHKLMEFFGF